MENNAIIYNLIYISIYIQCTSYNFLCLRYIINYRMYALIKCNYYNVGMIYLKIFLI